MELFDLARELGPWAGAITGLVLAWRSSQDARKAEGEATKLRASSDVIAMTQLRTWIDELRGMVRSQQAKIRRLEREANGWEMKYADLQVEYDDISTRSAARELELQGQIDQLEARVEALDGERRAALKAIDTATHGPLPPPPPIPGELRLLPGNPRTRKE